MKRNRTNQFITISSIALLLVLIIQVNWIFETAEVKEDLFNEKANMILARTTEAMRNDTAMCKNIDKCVDLNSAGLATKLGKSEIHKIDSLFNYYMRFYNFQIDYTFEVAKPKIPIINTQTAFARSVFQEQQGCYNKSLEDITTKNGVELKLIFPEKKQYIIAEMGTMFITSVILILIVLVLFWRTILSLMKEKQISEHTNEFLNNMTHEFKTPLTNIALAGRMILKETSMQGDKIKQYSEIILEENEKLRLQVEQVLGMTALERGEIPLLKTELDFHEIIRDALKCMSIQIENKHGKVKLTLDADRVMVNGDKVHLTNALCNLIDNAIKYSKEKPVLTIETFNDENKLLMIFSDEGIGIEKEYQKKVFDKFFRVPTGDVHNVKGFGLGLAYVKKIIELHGGTIELFGATSKGTTFIITLPNA